MSVAARFASIEPESRGSFAEFGWKDINQPGAYVDKDTGHLYRIPRQALRPKFPPLAAANSR